MNLQNKSVLFLGSSVTYGSAAGGVSFAEHMAEQLNFRMIKEAVSGTTLADTDETSYVARLKKLGTDMPVDLFICQLSTNDAWKKIDPRLTESAIREIVAHVRGAWNCPIAFYTGTKYDSPEYAGLVELLLQLAQELDFSVLDLWHDPEMNAVSPEDYARYMHDPVHPFDVGYREWWTPKFVEFVGALG